MDRQFGDSQSLGISDNQYSVFHPTEIRKNYMTAKIIMARINMIFMKIYFNFSVYRSPKYSKIIILARTHHLLRLDLALPTMQFAS